MHFLIYPATVFAVFSSDWLQRILTYPLAFGFALGVLVFIHEFGHYAVAKLFKVRVEVFSLGFGKRLWGFRRGDTDYRLSVLPLGGYVKMAGENPMEERTGDPGEFMSHPRWQRFLIAIAGPSMNIIFAIVVLTVVYMYHHEYPAYAHLPVDVVTVMPNSPAEKAGLAKGDRITEIEGIQNPDWQQFLTQESIRANQNVAISVLHDGALRKLSIVPEERGPDRVGDVGLRPPFAVGSLEPGKPAEQAGLKVGDVLVAANGTPIKTIDDMLTVLQDAKGAPVQVTVLRDGQQVTSRVTPQLLDTPKQGKIYRVGIGPYRIEKLPFRAASLASLDYCRENSQLIFTLVGNMLDKLAHFHKAPIQQFSGPIGIMKLSGEAALVNFWWYFEIMALISLNLAVFNLFPIPILDGGLMLMLLIEGIMRRDIKQEVKERVYQAAFVFLIVFAAVVIFNDVAKSFHF